MTNKKLLIGTSKGLVIFEKKRKIWQIQQIHFLGMPVSVIHIDRINNIWWVGIAHHHWGQKLHFSKNKGKTWQTNLPPKYPLTALLSSGKPAILKKIWAIKNGGQQCPNRLWVGTEPGGLFLSNDYGQHFELVESLWQHPSRMNPKQWFGTGRNAPYIHSIVIDPRDNNHIYIAVSCAGVFETKNGGNSWQPRNKGLVAAYLPDPAAEIGHDPHLLLACQAQPDVLWQQNHCGIFRSPDAGQNWADVSDKQGIANYGFALAIDPENSNRAWVVPAISDTLRVAPNQALTVCRTEDGGKTWQNLNKGLPTENCFDIVFRHALAINENLLAFGTTTGNVYLSENQGDNWICLSNNLARVDCVNFTD